MDATTKAIAHVLRQWHEAPSADVIDFKQAKQRIERERWLRKHTRPFGPINLPPGGGRAA